MPNPNEFEPYIRAWQKRFKERRQEKAELARKARREALAIAEMLADRFEVEAVYLIGSALDDERFDETSDLDLAVRGLNPLRYWEAMAVAEELTRLPFDLIDLGTAGESMRHRVEEEGLVLYDRGGTAAPEP